MQLPRQDHYEIARDAALQKLLADLDAARLEALGARVDAESGKITVPVLCWQIEVQPELFQIHLLPGREPVQISWQIIALNYLAAPQPQAPHEFLSFADFAEGRSYLSAFDGRVCRRLSQTAGREAAAFEAAARRLGAEPIEGEPTRCIFRVFPLFELEVVRYEADEDFAASCNVLLPDNTLKLFSLEDGIVAAERLVSALEGKTPAARKG
jgi:hypothetical protein